MASPIRPIGTITAPAPIEPPGGAKQTGEFQKLLEGAIDRVEGLRHGADQSVQRFLSGEGEELHSTVLATQRAELAFELFLQVRNKVVQAYQEIMRMQM
jgi:flagellar hook-basal body complex protein FliE